MAPRRRARSSGCGQVAVVDLVDSDDGERPNLLSLFLISLSFFLKKFYVCVCVCALVDLIAAAVVVGGRRLLALFSVFLGMGRGSRLVGPLGW